MSRTSISHDAPRLRRVDGNSIKLSEKIISSSVRLVPSICIDSVGRSADVGIRRLALR